ncbi:MAG: hypothetical protein OQK82_02075 [Candidatus Pacearchaeota archaeon]|nr:hypothetical protein [Candidatus Pacearchaeota archaeon]
MVAESEGMFPQIFSYTQPTEPTDKTKGKFWYNTSSNVVYVSNGTSYEKLVLDSNDIIGSIFQDTAQCIFNSAYLGFDSRLNGNGNPNFKNIFYDIFTGDTADTKINWAYDNVNNCYTTDLSLDKGVNALSIDEFDDSSIDTGIWTINSGSPTETSGNLRLSGNSTVTSVNDIFSNGNMATIFCSSIKAIYYGGVTHSKIILTDGTNSQILYDLYATSGEITESNVYVYLKKSGNTIYYKVGDSSWNNFDVSSWSNTLLRFQVSGANGYIYCDWARYYTVTPAILEFQNVSEEQINNSILLWNAEILESNNLTAEISANGTNYEEVGNSETHHYTNIGVYSNIRFTLDVNNLSSENKIFEYANKFNLS